MSMHNIKEAFRVVLAALFLAGCGGGSSPAPTPSYYTPPVGQWADFGVSSGAEVIGPISNPFSIAAKPSSNNMIYTQPPSPLAIGKTITLDYSLDGNATLGVADPSDTLPATITIFVWERGDNLTGVGQYEFYRWFAGSCKQALTFADHVVIKCPIDLTWGDVFGKTASMNPQSFQQALSNAFAVGFGFGGESFDAHGVYTTSGSAKFTINSFTIQ